MASEEGVDTTARVLGVDRDRLARRVSRYGPPPTALRRALSATPPLCQAALSSDPFSGTVFVFRNRLAKALWFDGSG